MKDQELDKIMKKHSQNPPEQVNIAQPVMKRIRSYEARRSSRILRMEYVLSAVVFISCIVSIFLVQNFFNEYTPIPQLEQYFSISRWLFTGIFAVIIFFTVFVVYFSSLFKASEKNNIDV